MVSNSILSAGSGKLTSPEWDCPPFNPFDAEGNMDDVVDAID